MTRRELLQEQHEDALFALLMDEVAISEGEKALEELAQLNADPTFAVPEETTRRMLKFIGHHFRSHRLRNSRRSIYKALQHIAVVAILGILLFTVVLAFSPELQKRTINYLVQAFPESTDFTFYDTSDRTPITSLTFGFVPDGYVSSIADEAEGSSFYQYDNNEGGCIQITCDWIDSITYSVDTEDAITSTVSIRGIDAMVIEKANRIHVVWPLPDSHIVIGIIGYDVSVNDIIMIANEILY